MVNGTVLIEFPWNDTAGEYESKNVKVSLRKKSQNGPRR